MRKGNRPQRPEGMQGMWAQGVAVQGGVCKPVSQRTQEVGCWILADDQIGEFAGSRVFWHLDWYSTRAAAQMDKGPRGSPLM